MIPPLPPRGNAEPAVLAGETTVTLDVGFGIRAVLPSRITVPVGESLRILAPTIGVNTNYIWTKNGRAIADASGNALVFNRVASSDAGTYACLFSLSPTSTQSSQSLVLGVGPIDRLLNLSTRTTVGGAADQGLISGFVVSGSAQGKKLILRAVGPSLAQFGVSNPHRAPILRIFDGSGKPYENGYVYPAVVGGPTYESDLADSLARAGAFAISAGTRDAVLMMPFTPGSYTAQVTSGDGTSGVVLLEIYEVP
ncbi:MAG: immunoglobulin domain-containing protein [Opitutus sp.]|nr:immunoglobulin domain-containing protein [Opitutus sp.]